MRRYSALTQVTGAPLTAPIPLVGPSRNRVALLVSIDTGTAYLTTDPGPVSGVGFPISVTNPLKLTVEEYGDIVKQSWFASSTDNATAFGVIETLEAD